MRDILYVRVCNSINVCVFLFSIYNEALIKGETCQIETRFQLVLYFILSSCHIPIHIWSTFDLWLILSEQKQHFPLQKLLLSGYSLQNRRNFLLNCIAKTVVPRSTFRVLHSINIFPKHILDYLITCAENLKYQEMVTNNQATSIGKISCIKNFLSNSEAEILWWTILHTINKQQAQLKFKIHDLCTNSRWKLIGNQKLIHNISTFKLSATEMEALSLGLKFATGLKKDDTLTALTKNHNFSHTEFKKIFVHGILAATFTNTIETTLLRRYIQVLKSYPWTKTSFWQRRWCSYNEHQHLHWKIRIPPNW